MTDIADEGAFAASTAGAIPLEAVHQIQQERDHLLLLHEALDDVKRAPSMDVTLRVFVEAIRRIGFGRAIITLRDVNLDATTIVTSGLSEEDDASLRAAPESGEVWRRRLASIERFRISNSYYLDGRDPWVIAEFGGGLESALPIGDDPSWSPRDVLLVPLRSASGRFIATLSLDEPIDRQRPTLTRVRTVELFAQQVAGMIEHASLMQLAERRALRLQNLHEVGKSLARSLDEPTILRTLAAQIENVLPVSTVVVLTAGVSGPPWPRILRHAGKEVDEIFTPIPLRTIAERAAKTQAEARGGSALAVPCVIGPVTVAALVVESSSGVPLDSADTNLLVTIAAQAAAAISNARLYAESIRQRRQAEALADVVHAVGESLRIERVLPLILRHAAALLRTDGATIALLRGDTLEVTAGLGAGKLLEGTRLALNGSMAGRAVRTGTSIIRDDVHSDPDTFMPSAAAARIRNAIVVPLLSVQGPVGALSVFNRNAPFLVEDAELLQRLADQVSVAVVNARLFEEVAEATREWAVAFDSIGSGMVLLDGRGRIQRTNAQARELMKVHREEEVLGHDFHQALFGDDNSCDECIHLAAIAQGTVQRGTHDDQVWGRIFNMTAAPHPLGGAVVTFDDVTAHRALAERYRLVVETSRDAIVITNRDRVIVFANRAAYELHGRGADLIGFNGGEAMPADQRAAVREHEDRALAGEPQSYEGVILRPDGERRIVAISTAPLRELGEVTGVVASLRDVTDERRARDAVVRSESRYRNLVESASDAIFTVDRAGRFSAVNRSLERGVGRARASLIGEHFSVLVDARDLAAAERLLMETFEGARSRGAIRYLGPGGEVRHGSVITSPVVEGQEIVGALGILRDDTDEQRLAEQLLQQEKLVAVGQLVSGVAHELNNPLAGVMAFAQILLSGPAGLDDDARLAAETIHQEAKRAAKIVSSLLTFARQQPAERRATQLNEIVTDTLELRRYATRTAGVQVTTDLDVTLPITWADPFQLQQVVLNLLVNAEQALAEVNGERRIVIRTALTRGGSEILLSISDNGPGIDSERIDRIFNPFFTTKPVGQGTGLGLSISDGIVHEHGGRIRVESVPTKGASFFVELPLVPPSPETLAREVAPPEPAPGRRRILVVDDEPAMRAAISAFLRSLGHEVQIAASGTAARAFLETNEYDAVLLDLRMPGLGGEAVYRELCQRKPEMAERVVFVTGDLRSDAARGFLAEAGRRVIRKPFQLDDLAAIVASVTG
ncbi:MAG: PAS domain S-box protein [Gemmatimonadota bacterium]|nr:PAS domain S-box protein [Gemmatimonadota bacterium]